MWPAVCTRRPVGPGCGDDARRDEGLLFEDDWKVGGTLNFARNCHFVLENPFNVASAKFSLAISKNL